MKSLLVTALIMLLAAATTPADEIYGPVPNYKGTHDVTAGVVIPTTSEISIWDPVNGAYHKIKSRGGAEFEVTYPAPVFVDSYVYTENPAGAPFDPDTHNLTH